MPADFRNFLSYDGKELVCLDIRNSQAFFSLNLLKKENIEEIVNIAEKLNKRDGKFNNRKPLPNQSNLPSSSYILSESLQRIDNKEIELYKKLVLSGNIYDYYERIIFDELGITYPSRKAVKEEFFRTIYSSSRYFGQPGAAPKRVFQKHFVLMRWESYVFLRCITKRISREYPNIPLFTIHDGIVTTKDHADLVSSIICEELKAFTGYLPMLKPEVWNYKNLKYYSKWNQNQT